MLSVVSKLKPAIVASQWKLLSAIPQRFSSSTGYTTEEIEKFRKVFRTMSTYEESISSKEYIHYLQSIDFIKPLDTYQAYLEYGDKVLGGRFELNQMMKYIETQHEPTLLMNEYLKNFDINNDGFVSKEEFELGMKTIKRHDARLRNVSYEKFVEEADTNKDGKISVAECQAWMHKNFLKE